jgi:phenylalanyl-tRNA synthetase beta chain
MRVPLEWLLTYCDPGSEGGAGGHRPPSRAPLSRSDVAAIEERLTMTGTKVEAIHHHGVMSADGFVVGAVLSVEQHPNADRLRVCQVDLGAASPDGPATIVCGAPNVAAGQRVAVALPGAVMPDGTKLKAAKLRGIPSAGMILAEDEIQIGPGHEGIMVLDALAAAGALGLEPRIEPGTPLSEVLPIATEVIELEITPNRPDCLGVYGVARELHAATGAPLAPEPWSEDPGTLGPLLGAEVEVLCPELCPRFTARIFENVRIAPSPPWLKARLTAAGQRPINNVVDITNYVMLLTGQPLHSFDLDRVAGGRLTVRRAQDGEKLVTLDGQQRTLDSEMVLIEDEQGPTSIAGLMGGSRSEVHEGTTRVLMEVANWHGPSIHHASWGLGLRSEASSRFEKGLAPEQCMHAQAVAARLMIDLCGATLAPGTIDVGGPFPEPAKITLRSAKVRAVLGVSVSLRREQEILEALGFQAEAAGEDLQVSVPPLRRNDVTREADLIEEVARIDGLERLPVTLPARRGAYGMLSETQRLRRRTVDALVGRGLYETVGWTFCPSSLADRLRLSAEHPWRSHAVELENPLSEDHALLRPTLLGSLLDSAARNSARGNGDLRLFEVGTVFVRDGAPGHDVDSVGVDVAQIAAETGVCERQALAVLLSGRQLPRTWGAAEPANAGFFAAKGLLEALCDALRVQIECADARGREDLDFLHPGRRALICAGDAAIGWIGELHPLVGESYELQSGAGAPAAMELDLNKLLKLAQSAGESRVYSDLISFPELRRDLAVVLGEQVQAAQVLAAVRKAGGSLLVDAGVFDVYSGPQVGAGNRSLALSLSFRAGDRTLSEEDVAPVQQRIVAALEELGGQLRG